MKLFKDVAQSSVIMSFLCKKEIKSSHSRARTLTDEFYSQEAHKTKHN